MHPLTQDIRSAFDGIPTPSKITLHVAEAHDDYDYDHDAKHRKKDFIGPWHEVPIEHFLVCEWALPHLDDEGIHYYLPALMCWVLENFDKTDSMLPDSLIYTLTPNRGDSGMSSYFDQRFSRFTDQQRSICARFLEALIDLDPEGDYIHLSEAQKALRTEWLKN